MRIGNGFDVHAFCDGHSITLGGVAIAHTHGVAAHSDGDVLIHALCDSLLGALALGDIGTFYPDNDEQYRGIDSRILLREVVSMLHQKHYGIINCDSTIICQAPKIQPYSLMMRKNLADDMGVSLDCVSVKASTTERLGFTGRGEGIAVISNCLIDKMS